MALVVLLRGINVGGHRTFRPSVLARQLKHLDVVNIGAAGTFVIRKPPGRARLRLQLARRVPFAAEIVICHGREIVDFISSHPFPDRAGRSGIVQFVSVLSRSPRSAPALPLNIPSTGRWMVRVIARNRRFIAGFYRRQMKVIGCLGRLDRVFGVPVTTRNWNTIIAVANVLAQSERGRSG